MIAKMADDHQINAARIYITGMSAGGAMTSVMLATYPEVFAAGAVIAGLPFGIAGNVREALTGMMASTSRPATRARRLRAQCLAPRGPWPKLSVWHGSDDRTVTPPMPTRSSSNGSTCTACRQTPMAESKVDGHPHQVWWNADGETLVESYTISGMPHGTPLGVADNDERYGAEGAFLIEAGISSS